MVVTGSGQVVVIVVPTPRVLSAVTVPLCDSMRCRTIARPSPVPPCSRDRAVGTRKN